MPLYISGARILLLLTNELAIEPDDQYCWGETDVTYHEGHRDVVQILRMFLSARSLEKGVWAFRAVSGTVETTLCSGRDLEVIEETLNKNREFYYDLKKLFRLQMAYLLLWSAIERYAALRYHLGRGVRQKVLHIADESTFKKEVATLPDNGGLWVYKANEPGKKVQFAPTDPKKSLDYYYQIRSNMTHRGKAEYSDFYRVHKALSELLPIFRKMLDDALKPHPVWR